MLNYQRLLVFFEYASRQFWCLSLKCQNLLFAAPWISDAYPYLLASLVQFRGESPPGTTSCETIEWSVSTCCSKFLGSIRLFLSAISYGRPQFLLWLVQQWSLKNEHIWHLFVACFALRPPHVMSWKDASDWVCVNYATMRLQSCVVLRTDVSSFHADWWLHGIWSCPPHRCWIMPLTFPWVLWLARALRGAGETSLSNPNRQTMANGHDWKYLWNNWKSSISTCESVPLWCFHCYS